MLGNRKQDKAVVSFKVSFWGNVKGRLYDVEFTYSVRKWRKNDDGHYDEWHFKSQQGGYFSKHKGFEEKNWVKSISDTTDKRKSYIVLTDEGRKAYDNQRKVIIRNLQECFRDVDEADLKMFCDKLNKVAEQIS